MAEGKGVRANDGEASGFAAMKIEKAKKVAALTLGCKVNFYDTEAILSVFCENGYETADFDNVADVYVINTCTVTNLSDKKSRQMIRRAKTKNPNAIVVVTGCYAQASPDDVRKIDGVNIIAGVKDKLKIFSAVENYAAESGVEEIVSDVSSVKYEPLKLSRFSERQRVFLKIEDGCNNFCSYCAIPYVRGRVSSRPSAEILREAEKIAENGFKEIVLTGICLSAYGDDYLNEEKIDLTHVVSLINGVKGIERVRLSSIEPTVITDEFLDSIKKLPKLCDHFHLPLQSGCDVTLKNMNRKYTTKQYATAVEKIRTAFPNASVTADIIAGFPGESDYDFEKSIVFTENIGFMRLHAFPFSAKKGTAACRMSGQIPKAVKTTRTNRLLALSNDLSKQFFNGFVGNDAVVLVEKITEDGKIFGHTSNYMPVYAEAAANGKTNANDFATVKLLSCDETAIYGKIIK